METILEVIQQDEEMRQEVWNLAQGLKYQSYETDKAMHEWFMNRFVFDRLDEKLPSDQMLIRLVDHSLKQMDWLKLRSAILKG